MRQWHNLVRVVIVVLGVLVMIVGSLGLGVIGPASGIVLWFGVGALIVGWIIQLDDA